jgi:hypothetical protein
LGSTAEETPLKYEAEIQDSLITIGPMTVHELSLQLRLPSQDVHKAIVSLKSLKQIYVCAWEDGTQVYAAGYARDAKKPPPKPAINQTFSAYLTAKTHRKMGVWAGLM